MRSEIYSEALRVIEKADDIIRDSTFKQKVYLKDMKSIKNKLQGARFAQVASAFLREQELILQIVNKIQSEFDGITGESNVTDINVFINKQMGLNPEYSDSQKIEEKTDIDEEWEKERPGYIGRMLEYGVKPAIKRSPLSKEEPYGVSESVRKKSNENEQIEKVAFLEGWYWKRTKSGKEYAKSFEAVYNSLKQLFNSNVKLLEKLDELRSMGDPQEYFSATKNPTQGFFAITDKQLKNEKFTSAWSKFNELLVEQDKFQKEQENKNVEQTIDQKFEQPTGAVPDISISDLSDKKDKIIEVPDLEMKGKPSSFEIPDLESKQKSKHKETPVGFEIPDLETKEPKKESYKPEEYESSLSLIKNKNPKVEPIKQLPEIKNLKELSGIEKQELLPEHEISKQLPEAILPKQLPEHKQEFKAMLPQEIEKNKTLPQEENKEKLSSAHNSFINQLVKLANNTSKEELACFILNYANEIDETDNKYALKLTAIAEGILEV